MSTPQEIPPIPSTLLGRVERLETLVELLLHEHRSREQMEADAARIFSDMGEQTRLDASA